MARPVSHPSFFINDPRDASASRGRSILNSGSLQAEASVPLSDPSDPLAPSDPFPLCRWAPALSGPAGNSPASTTRGVFGCFGCPG